MKKKRIIMISLIIVMLIGIALGLFYILNKKEKPVKKVTTTTTKVTQVVDVDKYKNLTKVRSRSVKGNNYEASIIDDELIVSMDSVGVKVNGIKGKVKYVADLGNFISYDPTFVVISSNGVYMGRVDGSGELYFSKLNEDVLEVYLVNELDYANGYVKQAYAYLEDGSLKKIEYNSFNKKVSLSRTYEKRFVDVFLWGNGGLALRIDKAKNDLVLVKTQSEEYDEKHEMVVTINFEKIKYNKKEVHAKYVILHDEGYGVIVITKDDEILYAKQNKDIPNENVLELKKYSDNKVKEVNVKENKIISITLSNNEEKTLNYDVLYEEGGE